MIGTVFRSYQSWCKLAVLRLRSDCRARDFPTNRVERRLRSPFFFHVCVYGALLMGTGLFAEAAIDESRVVTPLNPRMAQPVGELLDSMGIDTHFSFVDSPYVKRFREVRGKILALGLHHIRDVPSPFTPQLGIIGVDTTLLLEPNSGTPSALVGTVKALNAAAHVVTAIEGANEPDMFWRRLHITWRGEGYPDGVAAWQHDLYRSFKADPATASIVVIGPALGLAGMADKAPPPSWTDLAAVVDWGNFHPYPYNGNPFAPQLAYGGLKSFFHNGSFPSVYIDQSRDAYNVYRNIYRSRPFAATETGYPTGLRYSSDEQQAKYLPRLFAEYFRLGVRRTFVYQLLDDFEDDSGSNADASFGLLRYDLSERPSFKSVAALASLLAQSHGVGEAVAPDAVLQLSVSGTGDFWDARRVHHLLLTRPDKTLLLLVWDEVSGEDVSTSPRRVISAPALPAAIHVEQPLEFRVDGGAPAKTRDLKFGVPDRLVAIEIGS